MDLPKVLVIGINAWREDSGSNTLMDIFRCWDPQKLALIYTRADLPSTSVCSRFFQISENNIINSLLKPWVKVGREVFNTAVANEIEIEKEHTRYSKAHKKSSSLLKILREVVWKFGNWKTPALKSFIQDFNPEVIFVPIYPVAYMGRIQKYITKITSRPTVCYLADDNYSYSSCRNLLNYIHRFWLRRYVGDLARNCNQMFVIVEKEKEDTDLRFGTNSQIITKSIDFTGKSYIVKTPSIPLKFVYTGKLIIGRDKSLAMVADAINSINLEYGEKKAELFIYSQTDPKSKILKKLNNGASHFCGRIERKEVNKVQQEADVVIFAESLIGKEANAAKLSFSTKITDYLGNGKCIFAIGKEYIAPIDYFKRNDSAIIVTRKEEILEKIKYIINNPELINIYGKKAFNCAVRNHEKEMVNNRFITAMVSVVK